MNCSRNLREASFVPNRAVTVYSFYKPESVSYYNIVSGTVINLEVAPSGGFHSFQRDGKTLTLGVQEQAQGADAPFLWVVQFDPVERHRSWIELWHVCVPPAGSTIPRPRLDSFVTRST